MDILIYIVVGAFATCVSKIEKRINAATLSIPIAIPIGIFSAAGAAIAFVLLFKISLLVIAFILFLITKLKFLLGAKIAGIIASAIAGILGIVSGPIGWVLLSIATLLFIGALKEATVNTFLAIYNGFFRILAGVLIWVRHKSDATRRLLPPMFHPLVLAFEVPAISICSAYSLWQIMDWLDGEIVLTNGRVALRLMAMAPFIYYLYKAYLRDTTPPNSGGSGLDIPMPISFFPPD